MAAIEILGLEKTYSIGFWRKRPKRALQPLHLRVEEGEIFGFLGSQRCGQNHHAEAAHGPGVPHCGSARILGMDYQHPEVKAQIGFLPEQPYFYDYLTARELLEYYGQLSGVPAKERSAAVGEMLDHVGLRDAAGVQLRKFSKGMLQRVGIAQAILHDPKVVFLDEPMSGLDPMGRREVRDLMEILKQQGKDRFLFHAHFVGCGSSVRPGGDHSSRTTAGRGCGRRSDGKRTRQVELVWQGTVVPPRCKALLSEHHVTGETVRAVLPEENQDAALEALRREHLHLISVIRCELLWKITLWRN